MLKIEQLEAGESKPFLLSCPSERQLCRGHISLMIDGAERLVFVKARCSPGELLLAFAGEAGTFSIGALNFAQIKLYDKSTANTVVNLSDPIAQRGEDEPWLGLQRPVLRQSEHIVAKLRVEVWTNR